MTTRAPVRTPPGGGAVAPVVPTTDVVPVAESEHSLAACLAGLQEQFDGLKSQVRQAQQLAVLSIAAPMFAHEVNNLITPMLNYAIAAQESGDAELVKKTLKVTEQNARILIAMSTRLLEVSSAAPLKRSDVAVRGVVQDALTALGRDMQKDGITVTLDVDETQTAWVDRLQLQQVLFNLFLNAREAMAPQHGGRLTVSTEQRDGWVTLEVRNTGEPIPAELLLTIFEPLQSSKQGEAGGRCRGLGLALCRDLIEDNQGTIVVSSDATSGTSVLIRLPASEASVG